MEPNARVKAVYDGRIPDQVPVMLDLSHWYKKNCNVPFDLIGFRGVDHHLVDLHKQLGVISYVEMGSFYKIVITGVETVSQLKELFVSLLLKTYTRRIFKGNGYAE